MTKRPETKPYPKDFNGLGDHLKKKRLDLGLSQKQVAEQIGVDATTIFNWERQRVAPAGWLIPKIINFIGYVPYQPAQSMAARLKTCRESWGLSREQMAERLGVNESTLAGWETERHNPTNKSLTLINRLLERLE